MRRRVFDKPHIQKIAGQWVAWRFDPRPAGLPTFTPEGGILWGLAINYCDKLNAKLEKQE